MNPKQQRIAIAEACGWQLAEGHKYLDMKWLTPDNEWAFESEMPDYCNDLNAMHEAEKELYARPNKSDGTVWAYVYESHLINITTTEIIATAAQRAEAFLKTLNLWEGNDEL